ncbi:hypothetical protein AK973_1297 [Pseudomonas brassicacearum]|nr:hypothetical protein AK973_1297 [Pseudomonas brassicacearum]
MRTSHFYRSQLKQRTCGSELARDSGLSVESMLPDPPLSRASSLLQERGVQSD